MTTYQYPFKKGYRKTTDFGKPGTWKAGFHIGVDLVGINSKYVYPVADGVVIGVNNKGKAYGNHVLVKHADGNVSLYAHLSKVNVKLNQKVSRDTSLGVEGNTGNSYGSHLHLELHKGGYKYPPTGSTPAKCAWLLDPIKYIESHKEEKTMEFKTGEEAIKYLVQKKILSSGDYWIMACAVVKDLGSLFIKFATIVANK